MTFFKPTTAVVRAFSADSPEGEEVQANFVAIRNFYENPTGWANVRFGYYTDKTDESYIEGSSDMWLSTALPWNLLMSYRKILNGTATSGAVTVLSEFILTSTEGNAAITS